MTAVIFVSRLPIVDEKAPSETDFDTILEVLRHEGPETACVFNCQVISLFYIFKIEVISSTLIF